MLQALFNQLQTDLGELEGDYRSFHLKNDIALSSLSYLIACVSILGMLRTDILVYKDSPDLFTIMVLSRIGYIVITIPVMIASLNSSKVRTFDRLITGWLFFTVIYLMPQPGP